MHLGVPAYVVGETVTSAMGEGDLLIAISGSGESEVTCVRARQASALGARVVAVTGGEKTALANRAEITLVIPSVERSVQYGGTGFEQAALMALDGIALQLQRELGRSAEDMDARHASVE
jgi:6-phospho-3-hexuloisomerase